jgi:hypothetical protein
MALTTHYKSQFGSSKVTAENLRLIRVGDTVSVHTSEEGTIFAKVKSIDTAYLTFQVLRHNFEPMNKTLKIASANITTIKHISVKKGIGEIS